MGVAMNVISPAIYGGQHHAWENLDIFGLRLTLLLPGGVSAATSRSGKDVEVEWMPFELRPYPNETLRSEGVYLQRAWRQSVYPLAQKMGVPIKLPAISP